MDLFIQKNTKHSRRRRRRETPTGQCELGLKFRGGKRRGAGRKNRRGLRAHVARPRLSGRESVHVTLKIREGLPSLRRKDIYRALRVAVRRARLKGLRLVHFNLLSNHVHMLVECAGNGDLSRGLQSLSTSLAKNINALASRAGAVFRGRYHSHVLKTPAEVRQALHYVLSNAAKHAASLQLAVDAYSSVLLFIRDTAPALKARLLRGFSLQFPAAAFMTRIEQELATLCVAPQTWLLRTGWQAGARVG